MKTNTERWPEIKRIFQQAVELAADKRAQFLAQECGDDAELRREVESLLIFHESSGELLTTTALDDFAGQLAPAVRSADKRSNTNGEKILAAELA